MASCSNIASLDISSSSLALNPTLLSKHSAITPFSKFNSLVNIQEIQKAELPESFNFPWKLRDIVIANVGKIHSLIGRMAAVSYVSRQQITEVIHEAFIANDTTLNESSALQWAEGFLFPPHVGLLTSDAELRAALAAFNKTILYTTKIFYFFAKSILFKSKNTVITILK